MTRREKMEAYRTTASYRRLNHRVSVLVALWAVACFVMVSFPREPWMLPLGLSVTFWLVAGVVMWLLTRLLLVLVASFIPDDKLQRHLREGTAEAQS